MPVRLDPWVLSTDPDEGDRFYFHVRNTLYMLRSRSWAFDEKVALAYALFDTTAAYLRENGIGKGSVGVILAGLRDGLKPVEQAARP